MKKTSLRVRLYTMLLGVLLLSITVIGYLVCAISYQNIMRLSINTSTQLVDKTVNEIDDLFSDLIAMPVVIGRDARVQEAMRKPLLVAGEKFSLEYEISAFLSEMNQYDSNIFGIYFFSEGHFSAQSKYFTLRVEDLRSNELYQQACQSRGTIWCPPEEGSRFAVTTNKSILATLTPVKEIAGGNYMGAVIIEVETEKVIGYLDTEIGENGFLYVCDEKGTPIIWSKTMDMEMAKEKSTWAAEAEGSFSDEKGDLIITRKLENCGWTVIGVVPKADLMNNVNTIVATTIIFCFCVLLLSVGVTINLANRILKPLDQLNEKMLLVGAGDLSARTEILQYDEVGALMLRFNEMVEKIDALMKRETENQRQLRLTELKALQAQIKPHFLYNTLDSIIWLARTDDGDGVIKMVLALTHFLKIGLSKGAEIIPLEQEIQHTASYLFIQNVRYKGKFTHNIELEEGVKVCPVPKLIVQPLVENAIYHGMKQKREQCHLRIWAGEAEDCIRIDVVDNGAGMSPETAEELRRLLHIPMAEKPGKGYGIANVNERIQILYGEGYGLSFETTEGEGSAFHIRLPKNSEVSTDDQSIAGR